MDRDPNNPRGELRPGTDSAETPRIETPEDWLSDDGSAGGLPEISCDFVARTLQRVMADRASREAGGSETYAAPLPLQAYTVPPVSEDFVDRTLAALREGKTREHDADVQWLNGVRLAHTTPEPSGDFVQRTLAKIQEDRATVDIPRTALLANKTPAPSGDFVQRTLAKIQEDRASVDIPRAALLANKTPAPSADFVQRTLAKIQADRSSAAPQIEAEPTAPVLRMPKRPGKEQGAKGRSTQDRAIQNSGRRAAAMGPQRSGRSPQRMWLAAAAVLLVSTGLWFALSGGQGAGGLGTGQGADPGDVAKGSSEAGGNPAPRNPAPHNVVAPDGTGAPGGTGTPAALDLDERSLGEILLDPNGGNSGPIRRAQHMVDGSSQPLLLKQVWNSPFDELEDDGRLQSVPNSGIALMAGQETAIEPAAGEGAK